MVGGRKSLRHLRLYFSRCSKWNRRPFASLLALPLNAAAAAFYLSEFLVMSDSFAPRLLNQSPVKEHAVFIGMRLRECLRFTQLNIEALMTVALYGIGLLLSILARKRPFFCLGPHSVKLNGVVR